MGQGELVVLCFVIDERTLPFFFKHRLPWSSPLKASVFKMFALASFKKTLRRDMSLDYYMIYVCTKASDWIWGIQTEMQTASSWLWSFAVFYFKKVWSSDIACYKTPQGAFFPPCQTATPFRDAVQLVTHLLVGSDVNIPAASEEPLWILQEAGLFPEHRSPLQHKSLSRQPRCAVPKPSHLPIRESDRVILLQVNDFCSVASFKGFKLDS